MSKKGRHPFNGEMRIEIDKRIYPDIDEIGVMDLVQAVLEGEDVEGIRVETFEVRGDDKTATIAEYDFASAFMRSAAKLEQEPIELPREQPQRKKRNPRKQGKKKH